MHHVSSRSAPPLYFVSSTTEAPKTCGWVMSHYDPSAIDIDGTGDLKAIDVPTRTSADLAPERVTLDGDGVGVLESGLSVDTLVFISDNNRVSISYDTDSASYCAITLPEPNCAPAPPSSLHDAPNPNDTPESNNTPISIRVHSDFSLPNPDLTKFARNAQWCADGRALLVVCEDSSIEVLGVGDDLAVTHRLSLKHPASVLSTAWFPTASPVDPASFCFAVGVRDCPVRLVDASDGRLRASYKIIDHRERFIAPHSMAFNMYMNRLYCGFEDAIEVFDVHNPGVEGTRLHTVPTKKSRDGLRGIVSAIAFAPDWSGLYAAGSYAGGIAMYVEETGEQAQGWLEGVEGEVTQIKFNPTHPHLVHAAFRRSSTIATWDIRKPVEPVSVYSRGTVRTNQRLWFDVSFDGRWLVAGDESGIVRMLDVQSLDGEKNTGASVDAHKDAVGAVTFHPTKPFFLSVSGSWHFKEPESDELSSSNESSDTEEVEAMTSGVWRPVRRDLARLGPRRP
ncbi:hypothetical protein FRC07_000780, partial [Ceratobasidium sp. 392]